MMPLENNQLSHCFNDGKSARKQKFIQLIAVSTCVILLSGCEEARTNTDELANSDTAPTELVSAEIVTDTSLVLGQVRSIEVSGVSLTSLPEAIAMGSSESVELGRLLFWDPILSGDMNVACATCHLPEFGYTDGRALSVGVGGVGAGPDRVQGQLDQTLRNAQSVLNTVWNGINEFGLFDAETAPMFWDSRTSSLALQALEPIRSQEEMRGLNFSDSDIEAEIISRLSGNSEYAQLFEEAYGDSVVTTTHLGQALADFQNTLIANNSPFDLWMRGDANAMSDQQLNGMQVFAETGCAECHSGPMFSDFETHVLGVREADGLIAPDTGNGNFAFRTPTLRQLAFTAPYFHGGQETNLADVIDFYDNPNNSENPNVQRNQLDQDFRALPNLNNNESNSIENFLEALSDGSFDRTRPTSVPSGLPVGGLL